MVTIVLVMLEQDTPNAQCEAGLNGEHNKAEQGSVLFAKYEICIRIR